MPSPSLYSTNPLSTLLRRIKKNRPIKIPPKLHRRPIIPLPLHLPSPTTTTTLHQRPHPPHLLPTHHYNPHTLLLQLPPHSRPRLAVVETHRRVFNHISCEPGVRDVECRVRDAIVARGADEVDVGYGFGEEFGGEVVGDG